MGIFDKIPGANAVSSFFNPQRGYQDADKQLQQSWLEAQGFMKPFMQAGQNELPRLQGAVGNLLDPAALENQWISGYQTSPYAQDMMKRSGEYGMDAASAMGLMGSSPAIENVQRTSASIMNADRQNYLKDLMDKYLAGVSASQNIYGIGANMGSALGQGALGVGENRAQMQYGAANAPGEMLANMLGMGISGLAKGYGYGMATGGAAGAGAGGAGAAAAMV